MSDFRVRFFKNLVSSDGHRFKCLQQQIDVVGSETEQQAVECASRTFEKFYGVGDWKLHADSIEVEAAERH